MKLEIGFVEQAGGVTEVLIKRIGKDVQPINYGLAASALGAEIVKNLIKSGMPQARAVSEVTEAFRTSIAETLKEEGVSTNIPRS